MCKVALLRGDETRDRAGLARGRPRDAELAREAGDELACEAQLGKLWRGVVRLVRGCVVVNGRRGRSRGERGVGRLGGGDGRARGRRCRLGEALARKERRDKLLLAARSDLLLRAVSASSSSRVAARAACATTRGRLALALGRPALFLLCRAVVVPLSLGALRWSRALAGRGTATRGLALLHLAALALLCAVGPSATLVTAGAC